MMKIEDIAKVCHEANRAYCETQSEDFKQSSWEDAPDWQRESCLNGVRSVVANPGRTPEESHQGWLDEKIQNGWVFGPVKDADKKEHPCCIAYDQLPIEQRVKDAVFTGIVKALLPLLEN